MSRRVVAARKRGLESFSRGVVLARGRSRAGSPTPGILVVGPRRHAEPEPLLVAAAAFLFWIESRLVSATPYRSFGDVPYETTEERPRIYGLETEYLVHFVSTGAGSAEEDDAERPPFELVHEVLFELILEARKAARSSGSKPGFFLENGGLVHMEVYLRQQSDTPILEAATPECRSPWDALVYSRAFDHLLVEVSRRSTEAFFERGYDGYVAFGKNNRDHVGVGFGCHENFLVHHRVSPPRRRLFLAMLPLVAVALLPAFVVYAALVFLFVIVFLVYQTARWITSWSDRLSAGMDRLGDLVVAAFRAFRSRRRLYQNCLAIGHLVSNALLYPGIWVYTVTLRNVAFQPFFRDLTSFLMTRPIVAGTGGLDFEHGVYALSQRAPFVNSLANIVMFGRGKTVYDLKALLYQPTSLFGYTGKLTVTCGDSTVADASTLLKIGPTALVIAMIEAGETFRDLRLARPLRALHQVSREGPWKLVRLRSGADRPAIDVQREYLSRARIFFAPPAGEPTPPPRDPGPVGRSADATRRSTDRLVFATRLGREAPTHR